MRTPRGWLTRLTRAFRPNAFDAEMAEEMRIHEEMQVEALMREGLSEQEAIRQSRIAFGSREAYKVDARESRMGFWLRETFGDIRYALRQFRKAPSYALVSILTLALGIGASVAMFGVFDGLLLRPMPYPEPHRLMLLFEVLPNGGINNSAGGVFMDWREHQRSFDGIFLSNEVSRNVRGHGMLERLAGSEVTHEFLNVLGKQPVQGRGFSATDDQPGQDNRVVMLSEEAWRSRFNASPEIVGSILHLDDIPHTVIGIFPAGSWLRPNIDFYIPAVAQRTENGKWSRQFHFATVMGRLKTDVSREQAEQDLVRIKAMLSDQYPVWKKEWSTAVRAPRALLVKDSASIVYVLMGAVALVLIIACANVANLLLARGTHRQQEMCLRRALGASTTRLVRQVLTESVLLSSLGGLAGLLLAAWGIALIRHSLGGEIPPALAPQFDLRAASVALGLSLLTGLIFGILPAVRSTKGDLNTALKNGTRGSSAAGSHRIQNTLIVVEVALTVVLLCAGGLLLRSLGNALKADSGFTPERTLAFDVSLPATRFPTPESRFAFSKAVQERFRSIPGVENVGTGMSIPFAGGGYGEAFARDDRETTHNDPGGRLDYVSPSYLPTLGARLLQGRWLTESDNRTDGPRVAIINEAMAKRLYPEGGAVGRKIKLNSQLIDIAGVIANLPDRNQDGPVKLFMYLPHAWDPSDFSVVVSTPIQPLALVPELRKAMTALADGIPMANVRTLDDALRGSLKLRRMVLTLISGFAVIALLMACIGLYGIMSYSVATRTRELAIRMALGADRRSILALITSNGMRLVLIGLGCGLVAAWFANRLMQAQLYGVSSNDITAYLVTTAALAIVGLFACLWPALRATRTEAAIALRAE